MKKIGMIVAVEISAVLKKYGANLLDTGSAAFPTKKLMMDGCELYIVSSGAGEIAAASAAQYLISELKVDMLLNFGVVGGLTEEMTVARLAVVTDVVHYDFDISDWQQWQKGQYSAYPTVYIPATKRLYEAAMRLEPELKPVICASGDKFIGDPVKKRELHEEFNADICEMEAAGIVLTANRNGVPCLLIKAVSDSMTGGAEEFDAQVDSCAELCFETLDKLIKSGMLD